MPNLDRPRLARLFHNLLRIGIGYVRRQEAQYTEAVRGSMEKQLRRRAQALGYELMKINPSPAR